MTDKEDNEMEQVEVVRCKDCVHAVEATLHNDHKLVCDRGLRGLIVVEPDFYCADGEEEKENGDGNRD